ncbi:MAG: epoxyqueuosine reductase [Desulfuromonadales bacterium]|nr:epoxyqueuosine reductase [Desulfuromonadales bacterium]
MEQQIHAEITRFVADHPGNHLPGSDSPYLDSPLVGFSTAGDPLYGEYKRIIGPFHLLPEELLPGAATVISWILPVSRVVRESNCRETELPSREWALTRTHGETVNGDLRRHLVAWLEGQGQRAVAPQYSLLWKEFAETPVGIASTWSERHAAYAAGLGTFSLSDGFITARGIAHRCGSVITDLVLSPTPRTQANHYVNCLHYRDGSCGMCIARCPVGAISRSGHDKARCRELVYGSAPEKLSAVYGVPNTGCGLCQTKVPCEAMIPPDSVLPS